MRTCAVIAEFNPFHYGHAYLLKEARRQSQAQCMLVLMSGNSVQRGEFAILDKWQRAQSALLNGADLVLELPTAATIQAADYFARRSAKLVAALQCDFLAFASQGLDAHAYHDLYRLLNDHQSTFDDYLKAALKEGASYPKAYEIALESLQRDQFIKDPVNLKEGNNLLGFGYYQELHQTKTKMIIIQREKKAETIFQSLELPQNLMPGQIFSASQLRSRMVHGQLQAADLPIASYQAYLSGPLIRWEDYYPLLKYAIISRGISQLKTIHLVKDGVETAIYQAALLSTSYEDLLDRLVNQRWTRAAVQRVLLQILLANSKSQWQSALNVFDEKPALRVLGFNRRGQAFLKSRRQGTIQLFTNLSQTIEDSYQLNLKVDRIYQNNLNHQVPEQIVKRRAMILRF